MLSRFQINLSGTTTFACIWLGYGFCCCWVTPLSWWFYQWTIPPCILWIIWITSDGNKLNTFLLGFALAFFAIYFCEHYKYLFLQICFSTHHSWGFWTHHGRMFQSCKVCLVFLLQHSLCVILPSWGKCLNCDSSCSHYISWYRGQAGQNSIFL